MQPSKPVVLPSIPLAGSRVVPEAPRGFLICSDSPYIVSLAIIDLFLSRGHVAIVPPRLHSQYLAENHSNPNCFFGIESLADFQGIVDHLKTLPIEWAELSIAIMGDGAHKEETWILVETIRSTGLCTSIMSPRCHTSQAFTAMLTSGCTHIRIGSGSGSAVANLPIKSIMESDIPSLYKPESYKLVGDYDGDPNLLLALGCSMVVLHSDLLAVSESGGWDLDTGFRLIGRLPSIVAEPSRTKTYEGDTFNVEGSAAQVIDSIESSTTTFMQVCGFARLEQINPATLTVLA